MFKSVVYCWVFIHQNFYRKLYASVGRERQGERGDAAAVPRRFPEKQPPFGSGTGRRLSGLQDLRGFPSGGRPRGQLCAEIPHRNPVGGPLPQPRQNRLTEPSPAQQVLAARVLRSRAQKAGTGTPWPEHKWVWPSTRCLCEASTSPAGSSWGQRRLCSPRKQGELVKCPSSPGPCHLCSCSAARAAALPCLPPRPVPTLGVRPPGQRPRLLSRRRPLCRVSGEPADATGENACAPERTRN